MATTAQKKKEERVNKALQMHQTYSKQQAVTGDKQNDTVINSFLKDSQNYIRESDSSLRRMSWNDATDQQKQNTSQTVANNMTQRSKQVRLILENSKVDIDPEQYKVLTSYLDAFDDDVKTIQSERGKVKEYYSQWKSETDYNAYLDQQKKEKELGEFDLVAGQKEID